LFTPQGVETALQARKRKYQSASEKSRAFL